MKNTGMFIKSCAAALTLLPGATVWADSVTGGASPNQVIGDNDPNGVASSITLSPAFADITSVSVTLNVAGAPFAYDGDYYAYLQFGSTLVTLMQTPGSAVYGAFGSPGDGMSITFSDAAGTSIADASALGQDPLTGSYLPQDPLSAFNGPIPLSGQNGIWTLFIADQSPGGVGSFDSWSLTVSGNNGVTNPVPDGANNLWLLAGAGTLLFLLRNASSARRLRPL